MSGVELGEAELGTVIMMAMSAAVERDILTVCSLRMKIGKSLINIADFVVQQMTAIKVWELPCQVRGREIKFRKSWSHFWNSYVVAVYSTLRLRPN